MMIAARHETVSRFGVRSILGADSRQPLDGARAHAVVLAGTVGSGRKVPPNCLALRTYKIEPTLPKVDSKLITDVPKRLHCSRAVFGVVPLSETRS
jgi:hypothetical protein